MKLTGKRGQATAQGWHSSVSNRREHSLRRRSKRTHAELPKMLLFGLCLLFICFAKTYALGGSDLAVYSQIKYIDPADWQDYRNSNYVSWYLLYIVFSLTAEWPVGYSLALLDLVLWTTFHFCAVNAKNFNWHFSILAMLSFAGVLFSYNILRQYISVVFLLCCILQFLNGKRALPAIFALLAALSHFSALFFLATFAIAWINQRLKINRWLIVSAITVSSYMFFSFYEIDGLRNASDLGDTIIEFIAYSAISAGFVFFFVPMRLKSTENLSAISPNTNLIINFLIISYFVIGVILVTGAPIWLINRLILTLLFFAISFTLSATNISARRQFILSPVRNLLPVLLLIPTIFLHPGALAMLWPQ